MTAGRKHKVPLPPGKFRSLFDGSVRSFHDDSESSAKRRKLLDTERAAAAPASTSRCSCEVCLAQNGCPIVDVGLSLSYDVMDSDEDDWCSLVSSTTEPQASIMLTINVKATEPAMSCPNAKKKWQNKYDKRRQIQEEWLLLPWISVQEINGQVMVVMV